MLLSDPTTKLIYLFSNNINKGVLVKKYITDDN